jgi:hypothetical protein
MGRTGRNGMMARELCPARSADPIFFRHHPALPACRACPACPAYPAFPAYPARPAYPAYPAYPARPAYRPITIA